jgi:hypothetical protein
MSNIRFIMVLKSKVSENPVTAKIIPFYRDSISMWDVLGDKR